jgi:hypothetical protein
MNMSTSPEQTAVLLIGLLRRVGGKRGAGTRWRISRKTLRRLAGRSRLHESIIESILERLLCFGFSMWPLDDTHFAIAETAIFDSWPLISCRDRLDEEFMAMKKGEVSKFEELIAKIRDEYVTENDLED